MAFHDGLLTAVVAGGFSAYGASKQNEEARHRAIEQMKFQKTMSNTAYQRAMKDMKLAGLNPILAYKQGGASAPSGAMAPTVDEVGPAVTSSMAARRQVADLKAIKATIRNTEINTTNTAMTTNKTKTDINKSHADTKVAIATDRNLNLERMILVEKNLQAQAQTSAVSAKATMEKQEYDMTSKFLSTKAGQAAWYADKVGRAVNPFSSAVRNVR